VSIIYNALQKAQQNRQKEAVSTIKSKHISWVDGSLAIIIFLLIGIAIYGYYPSLKRQPTHTQISTKTLPALAGTAITQEPTHVINLTNYKSTHVVNGVYLSQQEKIALINNKFFHLGDSVDGMKLVSIESNRIVLRQADNALIIQVEQS
jgi:hypothetical protein